LNVIVFFFGELLECTSKPPPAEQGGAMSPEHGRSFAHLHPDVASCVQLLVEIVDNCRHLAEVDSGTYVPVEDEMNLRQLAESCLGIFGREREAGLVFDLHCPPELTIVSDRLLWRHVLMNLVGNAIKFTMRDRLQSDQAELQAEGTDDPRVAVNFERVSASSVRVEVVDNGPGIDIDDQAKIFGKFAQASRGFKAQGLGSGLGLHLSAKTIQMLRGELKLTSPLPTLGCGASFGISRPPASCLRLPIRALTDTQPLCTSLPLQNSLFPAGSRSSSARRRLRSARWLQNQQPFRRRSRCGSLLWRTIH
jgi:signal transduction histidine kinase